MLRYTINVRYYGGGYIARVQGQNVTASCTMSAEDAAKSVAKKFVGRKSYVLTRFGTADTWTLLIHPGGAS